MGYLDSIKWSRIKSDLEKGLQQGVVAVRKGAMVVKKRAGELGEESKKQYKLMALKSKVHTAISDLGARVYTLMSTAKTKNPALDPRVKDIMAQIRSAETQMAAIEKKKVLGKTKAKTKAKARKRK